MNISKIGPSLLVIGLLVFSGLAIMPATAVQAEQRQPDLVGKGIGAVYPVIEGEELPMTIYIENIGDADVEDGFWMELKYAETAGFWQEPTETFDIWVEPPIRAGGIKGVKYVVEALASYQVNFELVLDTTDTIAESNEGNNVGHECVIPLDIAPGTSATDTIHVRNENIMAQETFTLEADESTIPEGWVLQGAIPPTEITAQPGENVAVSETLYVPENTILNQAIKLNVTRQSDGASQSIYILVQTTPEMAFSFNPYTEVFTVWGVDTVNSEVNITSEVISQIGLITTTKYTVTNTRGQYISSIVKMVSTKHLNFYEITELDYNGVITIIPEDNFFLTTFKTDKNNGLVHFHQVMRYDDNMNMLVRYKRKSDETILFGKTLEEKITATFSGFDALGVKILNGGIHPTRLYVSDKNEPMCPNPCLTSWACRLVYT